MTNINVTFARASVHITQRRYVTLIKIPNRQTKTDTFTQRCVIASHTFHVGLAVCISTSACRVKSRSELIIDSV